MPLSINTNVASLAAQRSFMTSNAALETSFERLSSGKRINSAVDDAAGLAIGTDLNSRVSGLNQAIRNTNDGISMVQIAEGALDEATSILQRMRDLAVQSANDSLSQTERKYLDTEAKKLSTTLDDVLGMAKFNDISLISSSADVTKTIHIGAGSGDTLALTIDSLSASILTVGASNINLAGNHEQVKFATVAVASTPASSDTATLTIDGTKYTTAASAYSSIGDLATALNTVASVAGVTVSYSSDDIFVTRNEGGTYGDTVISLSVSAGSGKANGTRSITTQGTDGTNSTATAAITAIDTALGVIAEDRANLGATQSQLESTVRNLANVAENTAAAAGRIMDTDYAAETANLTKAQILQQAATSILAQANAQPQAVLSLLQ